MHEKLFGLAELLPCSVTFTKLYRKALAAYSNELPDVNPENSVIQLLTPYVSCAFHPVSSLHH